MKVTRYSDGITGEHASITVSIEPRYVSKEEWSGQITGYIFKCVDSNHARTKLVAALRALADKVSCEP